MCADTGVNGILNVLKPPGMTSHDVVGYLRRLLKTKKVGHTGTLDPGVAGVLPICLGKATKTIEYMSVDELKEYRAEVTFGRVTDTEDGFGQTIREQDASHLAPGDVSQALNSFLGLQSQVPPMVSAVKHQGKKLYELARQGIEVERKPRTIQIHEIRELNYTGFGTAHPAVLFDIKCSRGTYIRTICHDLGELLQCGAYMSFLVRITTGDFTISEALTLEEIDAKVSSGLLADILLPLDTGLKFVPVWVYDDVIIPVTHGNKIFASGIESMPDRLTDGQYVRLMNRRQGCLAVARVESEPDPLTDRESSPARKYMFQPVKVLY